MDGNRLKCVLCFALLWLVAVCSCAFDFYEVKYGTYGIFITSDPILKRDVGQMLSGDGTLLIPESGETGLIVNNKNKVEFLCKIPPLEIDQVKDRHSNLESLLMEVSLKNVTEALDFLRNTCIRKTVGWWTYELCYGRQAKQYHVDEGKIVDVPILLGHYAYDFDWENRTAVSETFQNSKQTVYHSQMYENGTMCDLVNRFRQTEVRFFCDNDFQGAYLYSVDEPASCQYVFNVHCSTLCRMKAFIPVEMKPEATSIHCHPLLTDSQFQLFEEQKKQQQRTEVEKEKSTTKAAHNKIVDSKRAQRTNSKQSEEIDKHMKEQGRQLERMFQREAYVNVDLNLQIGDDVTAEFLNDNAELNAVHQESDAVEPNAMDAEAAFFQSANALYDVTGNEDELEELWNFFSDIYNRAERVDMGNVQFSRMDNSLYKALKRMIDKRSSGVTMKPKNPFLDDHYLFDHKEKKQQPNDDYTAVDDTGRKSKAKVKVNVEKIQTVGIPLEERGKVISSTQRLEKEIQNLLSKTAIDGSSKTVKVKLLTAHQPNGELDIFNREELKLFGDVLSSILTSSEYHLQEKRHQDALQRNYDLNFQITEATGKRDENDDKV